MKIKTIHQELKLFTLSELKPYEQDLIAKAIEFLELSYAPYSHFNVSTALLLENGEIIAGANQENASYPLCLCAERVALHHAAMRYPGVKIDLMAVTARNINRSDLDPIPPCGACRQVIAEYQEMLDCKIRILLKGSRDEILELTSVDQVLPLGFNSDFLQIP
jgi:cytidine deaminase